MTFWETMINTWIVMAVLVGISIWITRDLRVELPISRKQHMLEAVVQLIEGQIDEVSGGEGRSYLPFIGTMFLFIAVGNLMSIIPSLSGFFPQAPNVYHQPTAALETTIALSLCALVAVPFYSIRRRGIRHWLRTYIQPTPFMLPFNIIGDVTRTLALAVRLFGNMMSGTAIAAILISVVPFFIPAVMQIFSLVTGLIQAYIFALLTMVYIAAAVQIEKENGKRIS